MNLFLVEYIGAFLKWIIHRFKTSFKSEYLQMNESKRIISSISIEFENLILGYGFIVILLIIVIFEFD